MKTTNLKAILHVVILALVLTFSIKATKTVYKEIKSAYAARATNSVEMFFEVMK